MFLGNKITAARESLDFCRDPLVTKLLALLQLYAGSSIGGAVKLNYSGADVVINWSGGLHHAKKAEVRALRLLSFWGPGFRVFGRCALCMTPCDAPSK
jgi:acetoin utilization deacetylase AcuC-like enzyme